MRPLSFCFWVTRDYLVGFGPFKNRGLDRARGNRQGRDVIRNLAAIIADPQKSCLYCKRDVLKNCGKLYHDVPKLWTFYAVGGVSTIGRKKK